jgi:DNA-binding ferritin-like protein (Dps family)
MSNSRIEEFQKNYPELNFSHFTFPKNWNGCWKEIQIYFTDSSNFMELDEFILNSKTRNLLETLLSEIYEDMCQRILTDNGDQ